MFLARNLRYPDKAVKEKTEGQVWVDFVIEKDGSVSNVKVNKSVSPELDAEAVRVVRLMPKWKPATTRGRAVACSYTAPIKFKLTPTKPNK